MNIIHITADTVEFLLKKRIDDGYICITELINNLSYNRIQQLKRAYFLTLTE